MKSSRICSFGGVRVARASLCERFKGDWCVPAGCNATTYTKSTVLSTYMHDNTKGVVQITQVQRASDSCQWEHVRLRLIVGLSSTCSGTLEGTEEIERAWEILRGCENRGFKKEWAGNRIKQTRVKGSGAKGNRRPREGEKQISSA